MEYAPPRIFMDERVFSEILFDAMGTIEPQHQGILVGERYEVNGENFVNIIARVPIEKKGDPFPFLFREEDYLEANSSHKLTMSQAVVVGWYRVGKGEGITDDEVTTHRGFFKFPWQLLLKVDSQRKEYSLYRASDGAFELADLLLYNDQFKGFFDGDPAAKAAMPDSTGLTEKYSGSIRRARKIIRELESELVRKDRELAEMRDSVRTDLASKIGRLEQDLRQEREKIHSLRSIVLKEAAAPRSPVPSIPRAEPSVIRSWGKKALATAASLAILTLGIGAIISEPPTGLEGQGLPSITVASTPSKSPAPRPAATPSPQKIRYTVKEGDSLWVISQKVLGDGSRFGEIVKENRLKVHQRLKPGTVLTITKDR